MENSPLWLCKFIVQRPKLSFGLGLGGHILLVLVTGILYLIGYDILPADFTQVPLNLEHDVTKLRSDAWKFARDDPRVTINPIAVGRQKERESRYDVLELVYKSKDGNIFTKENLKLIQDTEDELFSNNVYQNKLCQVLGDGRCRTPMSIMRFFDGSYRHINAKLYDPKFEDIPRLLSLASSLNQTRAILDFHLGNDAVIDTRTNTSYSRFTRSLLYLGYPLKGFLNIEDQKQKQWDKTQEFARDAFAKTLDKKFQNGLGDSLELYYYLRALFFNAISEQVIYDLLLAAASFAFIFFFMLFQTQSAWITGWAVFSILTCFFGANIVYRIILDCRYIGIFHVLSVFIILGIGADDVFVFVDTWKATENVSFHDLSFRLSHVYRRAASAMFITSFTTMAAFFTSVFSPLLGVSTFGIFSALLVFVNYCSVILFFPTVIVTHELFWKRKQCSPCCDTLRIKKLFRGQKTPPGLLNERGALDSGILSTAKLEEPNKAIVNFFKGFYYTNVVTHKLVRWVVLSLALVFLCTTVMYATKLEPDQEQVEVWGPGTNWHSIKELRNTAFKASLEDRVVQVNIIWGLKEQDRSHCHFTDFKCKGVTVLDESFDMNPPPCQIAMLNMCKELKNLPKSVADKLKIRRDSITDELQVQCFVDQINQFLKKEAKKSKYPNGTDFSIPVTSEKMKTLMRYNPGMYNVSSLTDSYYRFFEVALGYWLTEGNRSYSNYNYVTYGKLLGGAVDTTDPLQELNFQGNKYGNHLLFASMLVNTTLVGYKLGYVEGLGVYAYWEDFIKLKMRSMPASCKNGFQATTSRHNVWHWLKVQQVLASNAVRGIMLGLGLAIPILIIMTTNWIVGLLAGATIAAIAVGVVGILPMAGWKLGVMESLNLTLVVGLAVDYVVHLADGYVRSEQPTRLEKVQDMLATVGVSVLSGACTTLGASVFMLAAKIIFFFQFGLFVFCTIGLSIVYALVVFTTLLALMGPEGKKGSLLPLLAAIKSAFHKRGDNEVTCDKCNGRGYYISETVNDTRVNSTAENDNKSFRHSHAIEGEEQSKDCSSAWRVQSEQIPNISNQNTHSPYILYASPV